MRRPTRASRKTRRWVMLSKCAVCSYRCGWHMGWGNDVTMDGVGGLV